MTVHIAILVEGATEAALKKPLLSFLTSRLAGRMPKLDFQPENGRISKGEKLRKIVAILLRDHDAVIALTDVYTGTVPPEFRNASEAREKMRNWVGPEARFHPHAAQYEFEAWLFPYWSRIQAKAGVSRSVPPHPS